MNTQTLYLMRHGQTRFNLAQKVQGACDSPLTPKGIEQAKIAKQYFSDNNISIDAAFASTQERASDTLELIFDGPYTRLKGLKEWDFGSFEGGPDSQMHLTLPIDIENDTYVFDHGGELPKTVQTRMQTAFHDILAQGHETVLAVSHGAACMLSLYDQIEACGFQQPFGNCSIFKINYCNGEFSIVERIDHDFSHLD